MIIDVNKGIISSDVVIHMTLDDIILAAHCNNESVLQVFEDMIETAVTDARCIVETYEPELERAAREPANCRNCKYYYLCNSDYGICDEGYTYERK